MKIIKENIGNFFNGFSMALADSVPGVSGGTIAFLLGFYDLFIKSLDDLFYGKKKDKIEALKYLFKIGIGWIIGFGLSATILSSLFTTKIYMMCSLFMGFIIASIPYIIKCEKDVLKENYINIIFALIGALIVIIITIIMSKNGIKISIDKLDFLSILYIFIAASIAISAMVLPGISGSTILLVFGLYIPIMESIKKFLSLDMSVFPILLIFGLGVIFGSFTVIKVLRKCLENHRSKTVYFIIGMMFASLYSIVMGPASVNNQIPLNFNNFNIIAFIIGGLLIFILELSKQKRK